MSLWREVWVEVGAGSQLWGLVAVRYKNAAMWALVAESSGRRCWRRILW